MRASSQNQEQRQLSQSLWRAIGSNDVTEVKTLLNKGVNVNNVFPAFLTFLHISAYEGRAQITQLLLDAKADITRRDEMGCPPLLSALTYNKVAEHEVEQQYRNKVQTIKCLLDAKAEVNVSCKDSKTTPLHRLVKFMFQESGMFTKYEVVSREYYLLLLDFLIAGSKVHVRNDDKKSPVEMCLQVMSNVLKTSKTSPLLPSIYRATSSMLAFSTSEQLEKLFTAVKELRTPNPWLLKQAEPMAETQTKVNVVQGSKTVRMDLRYLDQVAQNYSRLLEAFKADKNSQSRFKQIPEDLLLYIAALETKDIAFPLPSSLTLSLLSSSAGIDTSYLKANVLQEAVEKEGAFANQHIQKIISAEVQR